MVKNIAVIGSSGAIGSAMVQRLGQVYPGATLHAFSRNGDTHSGAKVVNHRLDYESEEAIARAAELVSEDAPLDLVFVAIGMLHDGDIQPEKSLRDLSAEKLQKLFFVNSILPTMLMKHFLTKLNRKERSVFAALSARVGSISDNRLGGWYSYRASKAALNMLIRNAAIEVGRRNKKAVIVGMHPGTVDSALSQPFQSNLPAGQLFTADHSAAEMLDVLQSLSPEQSGRCFAWDGQEIVP
jgi:NAD(P)-dependent dehydrogenase (short-subunit alcohol dehydrogenase family)